MVAGAGLFSGIVHPDREGGEGDQERQGRPFMRLHKSSQEPPRARQPARTALGFTESNIFAGTAREGGRPGPAEGERGSAPAA